MACLEKENTENGIEGSFLEIFPQILIYEEKNIYLLNA
jgi:hypothetical protein